MEPSIAFTTRKDGVRIAYTTLGQGPAIVYPPGAFSRLELEFSGPELSPFYEALSKEHTLVVWDRHGVGHSHWDRQDFSFEDDLLDMEAVVDALKLDRFSILGVSFGGPIAMLYAARHPGRVTSLILYGTRASLDADLESRRALADLIRNDIWLGMRAIMLKFVPSAPEEATGPLARLLSDTAPVETTAALWEVQGDFGNIARKVGVPSLVLHRRDDHAVPFEAGRELASLLPDSQFVSLSGENHPPIFGNWKAVSDPILAFLDRVASGEIVASRPTLHAASDLSEREVEVLRLIAQGKSNPQIAEELFISRSTVQNHVSNILIKLNLQNRSQAAVYANEHGIA